MSRDVSRDHPFPVANPGQPASTDATPARQAAAVSSGGDKFIVDPTGAARTTPSGITVGRETVPEEGF